jgi:ABC-type Mn2+/Zn2+ transport system ATPase subunit
VAELFVRFDDVALGYGRTAVLEGLSFAVRRGDFLGIVGPNGAGKTTILRAILGLLRPLAGRIEQPRRPVIGYVPQREHIDTIIPVTAMEVALMGRAPRMGAVQRVGPADRAAALRALDRVGVVSLGPDLFRDLSGGQQQRVLLARALASEPDLLVLDEPTNNMDLASQEAIVSLLEELNRSSGLTVLLVTHMLPVVLDSATTMLLLEQGRVLFGAADEVLREDLLGELFGVAVRLADVAGRRTLVVERDHVD